MTLSAFLDKTRWNFYEAGLMHIHSTLRQFADSGAGSGVTLTGATFGALDMQTAADLATAVVNTVNDPGQGTTPPPTNFRT